MRTAIVLAAGNGDRFLTSSAEPKLLQPLMGRPLIFRTLEAAQQASVAHVVVVLGYQADQMRLALEEGAPDGLALTFVINEDWHLENGVSVRTAQEAVGAAHPGHFALLMGDHVFEPSVLRQLFQVPLAADESVLAVDARTSDPRVVTEATKVKREGERIVAIGKDLAEFDALDTGMFVCAPNLFEALALSCAAGDTTLSGGIRRLAAERRMRAFDIGGARWRDIDTVEDLAEAETGETLPT